MFKALQMKKIRVLVLDEYLDSTMNILGELGKFQIRETKRTDTGSFERGDMLEGYTSLLNKIENLSESLGIEDKEIKRSRVKEKDPEKLLTQLTKKVTEIDSRSNALNGEFDKLSEEKKVLETQLQILRSVETIKVKPSWVGL